MATILHTDLPDADLHKPKNFQTAFPGTTPIKTSGTGIAWVPGVESGSCYLSSPVSGFSLTADVPVIVPLDTAFNLYRFTAPSTGLLRYSPLLTGDGLALYRSTYLSASLCFEATSAFTSVFTTQFAFVSNDLLTITPIDRTKTIQKSSGSSVIRAASVYGTENIQLLQNIALVISSNTSGTVTLHSGNLHARADGAYNFTAI